MEALYRVQTLRRGIYAFQAWAGKSKGLNQCQRNQGNSFPKIKTKGKQRKIPVTFNFENLTEALQWTKYFIWCEDGAGENFSSSWAGCYKSLMTSDCAWSNSSPWGRDAEDLSLCRLSCPVCVILAIRTGPLADNTAMMTGKRAALCISSVWQSDCRKNFKKLVVSEVPLHPTLFIIHVLEIYPTPMSFCVCLCSLFCNSSN